MNIGNENSNFTSQLEYMLASKEVWPREKALIKRFDRLLPLVKLTLQKHGLPPSGAADYSVELLKFEALEYVADRMPISD